MTVLVTDFINGPAGVRVTLIDSAKVTWSDAELLGYLNEALRATAFVKPDMYTIREEIGLEAGTKQVLPAGGISLMDIYRNTTSSGGTGRVVTQVDEGLLEEANRFWPAATQQQQVEHFTADPRDPRRFTVFPPNDGTGVVELLYGAVPPELTDIDTDALPVPDSYENVLKSFVLASAYAKNSTKQDLGKWQAYMGSWSQGLGMKTNAQFIMSPKVAPGGAP